MTAPIIVTALFGGGDFRLLDDLRREHFPAARNLLQAHLTLFHHLPPTIEAELCAVLRAETGVAPPPARLGGLLDLGGGTALRVHSEALRAIRGRLAERFADLLVPQDRAGWRPHVTIQNKVARADARALQTALAGQFEDRPLAIAGLAAWWYRGGPWEEISRFAFGRR